MKRKQENRPAVTLQRLIAWSKGACAASQYIRSAKVLGLCNDSRIVQKGEVFIAITTDKDDGHRYVADALSRGALAALVSKKKASMFSDEQKKKLVFVADPLSAIRQIARNYRKDLGIPVIGITGSSGKTTARAFIATVLKQALVVGETHGNWNNAVGVAMSLMRFTGQEDVGVLEMGANHMGEIHDLSTMVRPSIGVITNIGYAHIGLFGSLENIARAKCEIVDGMGGRDGFLMVNGDDNLLMKKAKHIHKNLVVFGFSSGCDIRGRHERISEDRTIFEVDSVEYELSMAGRHYVYSALMALYLGRYFGVQDADISRALRSLRPVALRGTVEIKSGAKFIVDCYNANPSSMRNAITLLGDVARKSRTVAIVGDMLELGKYSKRLHTTLGKELAEAKVDRVLAVGNFAEIVAAGAIKAGMKSANVCVAQNSAQALDAAKDIVKSGDTVLLKGSRGVRLETVFENW
jgi:UDP-N-acetylmuramoyl-tripeptide--D-alanyl-D-alanine ligase